MRNSQPRSTDRAAVPPLAPGIHAAPRMREPNTAARHLDDRTERPVASA
jgi:hypothetical protein